MQERDKYKINKKKLETYLASQDTNKLNPINWQELSQEYRQQFRNYRVRESGDTYYNLSSGVPRFPGQLKLRDYQKEAITNWLNNRGRGTLKMATGSGKTIIALAIATHLYKKINLQVLIIICPYRHLVLQWNRECKNFNLNPVLAMNNVSDWQKELSNQLYNIRSGKQKFLTVITTNSTLISEGFQSELKFLPAKTIIVGDEVHNLGSERQDASLPRNIGIRLGLSATPKRYYDEIGTDALLNYFGKILQPEFTLEDAIKKRALVPYDYYPVFVQLTESESYIYAKITKQIAFALSKNSNFNDNENLTSLLTKRSRLIGSASNKLNALKSIMENRLDTTHTLFYCSDAINSNGQKQIDLVTRILGNELGYRVNTYTSENSLAEREQLRIQFEKGGLQGLVAIRCLDEGVDIPIIKTAIILASTSNPRQFIQRRGRVLRPYPGKEKATIFDFIVTPPQLDRKAWLVEKRLLQKELNRFIEFAELADNSAEARKQLLQLESIYL